ncbi:MAG: O-antigen ligase family protein [Candidatus Spechtbacterales bacterium]|nr:O-antigen ligase family protein [Candidatus Spechtbacterales bacterium]
MKNKLYKAEKYLFLLLLFSIPFQKRVFLWSAGIVDGFNEWQSIFLYGTDILVFILFGLWAFGWLDQKQSIKWNIYTAPVALALLLLIVSAVSIFNAAYVGIAVYRFIKIAEFIGLFFYTIYIVKKLKFEHVALAFVAGGIFQSIIAISQFFMQRSVGLGILGESPLSAGRSDVAEFIAYGSRFMRAYGTFPSPNVLAAFLSISLLSLISWYIFKKNPGRREKALALAGVILIAFALLLTFSRAAIASVALVFAFYLVVFMQKNMGPHRKKLFSILTPLFFIVLIMAVIFWPEIYSRIFTAFASGDTALSERAFYSNIARDAIKENPAGLGIGNYTLYMRSKFWGLQETLYQPVHNLYLLVSSELGIAGGIVFISFLGYTLLASAVKLFKKPTLPALLIVSIFVFVLVSGFFDHFYWTLQQGSLMLWIVAGMVIASNRQNKSWA